MTHELEITALESRQMALRAYCPIIYTVISGIGQGNIVRSLFIKWWW